MQNGGGGEVQAQHLRLHDHHWVLKVASRGLQVGSQQRNIDQPNQGVHWTLPKKKHWSSKPQLIPRVSKKSVKKYTPITGCTKEPREICAPAGCGFKKVLDNLKQSCASYIFLPVYFTRVHWSAMTKFRLWCRMRQRSSVALNLKERASMWRSWCPSWNPSRSAWTCRRRCVPGREPIPGRWRGLLWKSGAMCPLRSLAWPKHNFPTPRKIYPK